MTQQDEKYNIDWSKIKSKKLRFDAKYIEYIDKKLIEAGLELPQRVAFISNVIAESGGDPFASGDGGKATGILQWHPGRYAKTKETDPYKELDSQIAYALSTMTEYKKDGVSWNDGGKGTGYMNGQDAFNSWFDTDDALAATKAVSLGYLRPAAHLKAADYRAGIADQILRAIDPNNIYNSKKTQKALINEVKKRADNPLVQSLKDPNRPAIPDHADSTKKVTHKMGWATVNSDKGNAVVFPNALNINGKFVDTTDPKNRYTSEDAFNAAVAQQDTLMFPQMQQAAWFTENYKNYFPGFDKYGNGGQLNSAYDLLSNEERKAVIEAAVNSGVVGLDNIRKYYNKFAKGGNLSEKKQ